MGSSPPRPTPYHVVPGPAARRRILLVCYHAPPSNEVGALRWTMMARYFAEQGWGFDIFAADPTTLTNRNDALLGRLPSGTRLYGIPRARLPLDRMVDRLVVARRRLRNLIAGEAAAVREPPTAREGKPPGVWRRFLNSFHAWREYVDDGDWARRAAEAGRAVFDPELHHWVISSGPPHMSHDGARLLSIWTGLPLLTDFRDPWRFQEWVPLGPNWRRLATKYEARAVQQSSLVVTNVEPVRTLMQRTYPEARFLTITNGIDDEEVPAASVRKKFIIGCPGTIYEGRDPTPLFQGVAELVRTHGLSRREVALEFMGHSGPEVESWLRELAADHGVGEFLTIRPGGPRAAALEFMATCAVLVAFQQGNDLAVPAKVFEYMRYPAWLVVLTHPGSATAGLLRGTGATVLDPGDASAIGAALSLQWSSFKEGSRAMPLALQERFHRRYQAERLLAAIEPIKSHRLE